MLSSLSPDGETKTGLQARLSLEPGIALGTILIMADASYVFYIHYITALHLHVPSAHTCKSEQRHTCTHMCILMYIHIHLMLRYLHMMQTYALRPHGCLI